MPKQKNKTSPKGQARWAHVVTPNTKFDEDGAYMIELLVSKEEAEALRAELEPQAKEYIGKLIAEEKDPKKKAKLKALAMTLPISEDSDENGEPNGKFVVKFKTKACWFEEKGDTKIRHDKKVFLFDAKGQKLDGVRIGNGSTVRVSYFPCGYAMVATGKYGVRLDLKAVQILDLVEFSGGNADSFGFEQEEGYVSEPSEMPAEGAKAGGESTEQPKDATAF